MSDELDAEETRLRALLRRSDGPLAVRPLGWSRPRKYGRALLSAAVMSLLLVVAVVASGPWEIGPSEVGTSSPSSTEGGSGQTGTPSSQPGEAFLVVNLGGHGIGLRTEAAPNVFFRVENRTQYAVSGNRLAYWKTGPDDALPHELHVYDTSTRSDRTVFTLTDERTGSAGFMAWSSDGEGLAIAVHDKESAYEGRVSPAVPSRSSWRLIDVGTGRSRTIGNISAAWLVPLSWDRSTGVATATEVGRDGPSAPVRRFYEFTEGANAMRELPLPAPLEPLSIVADPAAQVAIGVENRRCGDLACRVLWRWRVTDILGATSRVTADLLLYAALRPRTTDVYVLLRKAGTGPAPFRIEDWGGGDARSPVTRVVLANAPDWFFFHMDGTALVALNSSLNDQRARVIDTSGGTISEFTYTVSDLPLAALGGPSRR